MTKKGSKLFVFLSNPENTQKITLTSTASLKNTCVSVWDSFSTEHQEMTSKQKWCGRCEAIAHDNTNIHILRITHICICIPGMCGKEKGIALCTSTVASTCVYVRVHDRVSEWARASKPSTACENACMHVCLCSIIYTENIVLTAETEYGKKKTESWASRI